MFTERYIRHRAEHQVEPPARLSMFWRGLLLVGGLCVLLGVGYVLWRFDPEQTLWSPKCLFRSLTGLSCPGCGSQRAVYHLLHGRWLTAIHYNVLLLPSLTYILLIWLSRIMAWDGLYMRLTGRTACWILFGLFVGFWVVRNLFGF